MFKNIISLVGMSGVGKTTFAMSQNPNKYFHYSVDYIIGQYLLKNDILQDISSKITNNELILALINKNSINLNANIKVKDLSLVSNFIGKFGSQKLGGLSKDEFLKRQHLYAKAEKTATLHLQNIANDIFNLGYEYIINDLTGSICEIIDFTNKDDEIMNFLKQTTIKYFPATQDHVNILIKRAQEAPKPLLYSEDFFLTEVEAFKTNKNLQSDEEINPDEFCRYIFPRLLEGRIVKYGVLANNN